MGAAVRVIKHMEVSNVNNIAAWELLRKWFENKRTSAWIYLRKFITNVCPTVKTIVQLPNGLKVENLADRDYCNPDNIALLLEADVHPP